MRMPINRQDYFFGRRVLVMGLGLHGGALHLTRWLIARGAVVRVTDQKSAAKLAATCRQLPRSQRLTLVLGRHRAVDFRWAEMVVQNPAVARESPYLKIARASGARIENEASLFFRLVDESRIVGVTGTRGKSTVSTLIAAMLVRKYPTTMLGGNIATAPMFAIIERARQSRGPVVCELSSWHLELLGAHRASPHIAVVTNVLPDHLNRYRSMLAYAAAKRQILAHQRPGDYAVLNADNPVTRRFQAKAGVTRVGFSRTFAPPAPGVYARGGWFWWREGRRPKRVIPLGAMRVSGRHNVDNALAAIAVAKVYRVPNSHIRAALSAFRGLPYRQQFVGRRHGVVFINDTAATTPDATRAALQTIGGLARGRRIVLIAGGSDKRLPEISFLQLADAIGKSCRAAVLFDGAGSRRIFEALRVRRYGGVVVSGISGMAEALGAAAAIAVPGDTVLLSPACASFGLFQHEFDRGDQFNQCVKSLL